MKKLNLTIAKLVHNLYSYAFVYNMRGICDVCDSVINCSAYDDSDKNAMLWACDSIMQRIVVDLGEFPCNRILQLSTESQYHVAIVEMVKLKMLL